MTPCYRELHQFKLNAGNQRRIKKRLGLDTKTTLLEVENKFATRRISPLVADLKLIINLVFFISFLGKRCKL